jgi:hypothetical protein
LKVCYNDTTILKNSDFDKEESLKIYIVNNIDKFTKDILEDELVSFEVEKPVSKQLRLSPRERRIDIFVVGKKSKYIVELKNPKCYHENRTAIGQLLDYGREVVDSQLVLITTKFDINTYKTIKYYDLPIRYIYFDKEKSLECVGVCDGK